MAKRVSLAELGSSIGSNSPIDGAKARVARKPITADTDGVYFENFPVEKLAGNPRNPRDELKNLEDLATIVDRQLQPLSVVSRKAWLVLYPGDDTDIGEAEYVVVNGNRRLAAAREYARPGLDMVVRDEMATSDVSILTAAVLENLAREDLDVIEEAKAVELLVEALSTASAVATALKRSEGWVSQRRALMKLDPVLQEKLRAGELGIREARSFSKVPREEQVAAWLTEQERKELPPVPPEDTKGSTEDDNKDDSDSAEVTQVDKIVKVCKKVKPDLDTMVAALEEYYDPADLIQLRGKLGN